MRIEDLNTTISTTWTEQEWDDAIQSARDQQLFAESDLIAASKGLRQSSDAFALASKHLAAILQAREVFVGPGRTDAPNLSGDPAREIAEQVYSRCYAYMSAEHNLTLAGDVHKIVSDVLFPDQTATPK